MIRRPPRSTLFPYAAVVRSQAWGPSTAPRHWLQQCVDFAQDDNVVSARKCESENYARQMRCWGSSEEYIRGCWCSLVACWLMAVAACVRRLPFLASYSRVLTLCSQRVHVNRMPPLMRSMV